MKRVRAADATSAANMGTKVLYPLEIRPHRIPIERRARRCFQATFATCRFKGRPAAPRIREGRAPMREWIRIRLGVLVSSSAIAVAALVLAGSSVTAGGGVTGAVFTTTNPAADNGASGSPVLCNNGNPGSSGPNYKPAINCNIYTSKSYVWMTGGPGPSGIQARGDLRRG